MHINYITYLCTIKTNKINNYEDRNSKKLGSLIGVENALSVSSGREVANQFIITYENGKVFQSYNTIIAVKLPKEKELYLDPAHDYSCTTRKYAKQFTNMNVKERRKAIKIGSMGMYKVIGTNLN